MMDLPENVIFNILLRFPVLSLLRFKCVCKVWCMLIESALFKDNYLALRTAKPVVDDQVVCLKRKRYEYGIYTSFVTGWYADSEPLSALDAAYAPSSNDFVEILPGSTCPGPAFITGHVNGIVCVKGGNRGDYWEDNIRDNWFDITLVNPALREFRKLPIPDFGGEDYQCYIKNVGFGYDAATNDYKLFLVLTVVDLGYQSLGLVYRLSTDSWRILGNMCDFVFPDYFPRDEEFFFSMSGDALLAHGSIHCTIMLDTNCRVLAFNLTTESFQEILYPRGWSYDETKGGSVLLTIDKSTIGLAASNLEEEERVLDIWVMKEYGDIESWSKLYSISFFPSIHSIVSFWRKDKLLLRTDDNRLICYDIITGQEHGYELGGSYDLSEGRQQDEPPRHLDPICGQPLVFAVF